MKSLPRYPAGLVHKYGAKAGILKHVKKHLPAIPQVDSIVKLPEESVDAALERADKERILWPRMFRSSSVFELMVGSEGVFPSKWLDGFKEGKAKIQNPTYRGPYSSPETFEHFVRYTIQDIAFAPKNLKEHEPGEHDDLPDVIPVIIAEKSPSSITGTFVKHPNQEGVYIISASVAESLDGWDPQHSTYIYRAGEGVKQFKYFTRGGVEECEDISDKAKARIHDEISQVVSWHDMIASLPEMDDQWSWQIEFGLDPVCLYQVRPFKPLEKADFVIADPTHLDLPVLVFGVTKGIDLRVERNVWERSKDQKINPEKKQSLLFDDLRSARHCDLVQNLQANILHSAHGMLAHDDIRAMRVAQVTVLCGGSANLFDLEQGQIVNLVSDGKNFKATRK